MRKFFSKLHLWLSIPFGIFISLVCLTGALLVFEDEINKVFPPAVEAEANTQQVTAAAQEAPARGGKPGMEGERAAHGNHWKEGGKPGRPEGGKPQMGGGHHKNRSPFFQKVLALHRWLLMRPAQRGDMTAGKFLVGLSVGMMVVVLASGVVIWWPRKGQSWKSRFVVSTKGGAHKFWYQLHTNGGLYVCILLLLMALTGLTWSFSWYRTLFTGLTGMEHSTLFELHTGKWGGLFSKTLYFVACLVGTTLPWTGYYFWWKRKKK